MFAAETQRQLASEAAPRAARGEPTPLQAQQQAEAQAEREARDERVRRWGHEITNGENA